VRFACASAALVLAGAACGGDDATPLFPSDYAATFIEVRDCRPSSDHDLRLIRVVADPAAAARYTARDADFAPGALIVKEEYDFGDTTCAGAPVQWTVMQRAAGVDALQLGWRWQRIDGDRSVVTEDEPRCFGCHADCGVAPDGYFGTCAVP
jgi:hypothetical protein